MTMVGTEHELAGGSPGNPDGVRASGWLGDFLAPASIAIVGASTNERTISGIPLRMLGMHGYTGEIYPIHPSAESVGGCRAYRSLADVPTTPDLALIAVRAELVPQAIRDCGARGIPAAYILSSGFSEGADEQGARVASELDDAIADSGVRVCGPNAEGIFNIVDRVAIGFSPTMMPGIGYRGDLRKGNVAVVSHSGGFGFGIFNQGLARGIDFSYIVSTGNEIDVSMLDYVDYLIDDADTQVIVLFIEGLTDAPRLVDLALRAGEAGKTIVAAKMGRSAEGQLATVSHTGHLAGPIHLYRALFGAAGIVEVSDIDELLDVTAALSAWPRAVAGRSVGIVTVSGGAGAWVTDVLREYDIEVPELSGETQGRLRELLPYYAGVRNPVDVTGGAGGLDVQAKVAHILAESPDVDAIVVIGSLLLEDRAVATARTFGEVARATGKPVLVHSYTLVADGAVEAFGQEGIPFFMSQEGLARGLSALSRKAVDAAAVRELRAGVSGVAVASLRERATAGVLHEAAVKTWLGEAGMTVPEGRLVTDADAAVAAAAELGYPLALKVQDAALPHKGDAGVLALGVADDGELRTTVDELLSRASGLLGRAADGVLVERMSLPGAELLLGGLNDPHLGQFITVGAGGSDTELLADTATLVAPASPDQVEQALRTLRCWPTVQRSGAEAIAEFAELAARVSGLLVQHSDELAELDLNPVRVRAESPRVDVIDGLAILR
ncbi:hypothetical protein GII33_03090 [Gordonia pseudamarae]|jgi:acyl-CoA synthetase (NDP forming)|uniref:ATP-grasp domain-containing protein n=1 Tax=Gordonia pseudamarae TaxID=2831662 RepID=A0ABX6IDX6_9ACTN|nr:MULTISPECIES: acetate--CoA ligase family protein [Gordonia]MBD0021611.1 acetate--CoA ligase family protein [Gordonia sp. (in: high G+C Gram-positive bacteria)]QHN25109.1 hypothetical protein GII33_03090 [Gordonia pseudamarae]QHN34042.1 hypothetical protein GII31_03085 [Gordonia pseudamarae]